MHHIWEASDIKAGRYIYRNRGGYGNNTTAYKIGFLANGGPGHKGGRYVLIAITDGMVTNPETKEEMAESLTKDSYEPLPFDKLIVYITDLRSLAEGY